jgi:transposase InsO family protein
MLAAMNNSPSNGSSALQYLLLFFAGWVNRSQQQVIEYLKEENRVLREQLGGCRLRLTDDQRRRLAVKGKALGRKILGQIAGIVTPDTILRWYRQLVANKYDGSTKRGPGRPPTKKEVADLVVRMAQENTGWGYTRLRDALWHLGHELGRNTVKRILLAHGIEPAPERNRKTSWKAFIKAHLGELAAADFFTVEVLTLRGLVRHWVFFIMDVKTRAVEIAGITCQPSGAWMNQIARNLTDAEDGFLRGIRYLIIDRDPLYTRAFREMLKGSGVEPLRLPARSPNLNAHAERFVLSIKSECLNRIVPLGEGHLRRAVGEFVRHYHGERPHQGLGGRLIAANDSTRTTDSHVMCRERLGGMLRYYYREAA